MATTPTAPLYHYTREPNLESILESQCLWCFSHADQSDKKEFSYSLQLAMDELDRIARAGIPFADEFARCTLDLVKNNDLTKIFGFYLFSLSESRDLESQWKKYAENGTGYQLGFAPSLFQPDDPLSGHADRNALLGKLIYGDADSSLAHRDILDKAAEIAARIGAAHAGSIFASERVHSDYINGMAKEVIARQLVWRSIVSKREKYRTEAERRFVIMNLHSRFVGKAQVLPDGRTYVAYSNPPRCSRKSRGSTDRPQCSRRRGSQGRGFAQAPRLCHRGPGEPIDKASLRPSEHHCAAQGLG